MITYPHRISPYKKLGHHYDGFNNCSLEGLALFRLLYTDAVP
jgi:hypothetical protein